MSDPKYKGTIETDKSYNDGAETELAFETFEFNGLKIWLPHPIKDSEGDRAYVSVDTASGYDVFIYADRIDVVDASGFTVVRESFQDLKQKCRIADNLAAVNRWK